MAFQNRNMGQIAAIDLLSGFLAVPPLVPPEQNIAWVMGLFNHFGRFIHGLVVFHQPVND